MADTRIFLSACHRCSGFELCEAAAICMSWRTRCRPKTVCFARRGNGTWVRVNRPYWTISMPTHRMSPDLAAIWTSQAACNFIIFSQLTDKHMPRNLTLAVRSQSRCKACLLIMMSRPPSLSIASWTACFMSPSLVRSPTIEAPCLS